MLDNFGQDYALQAQGIYYHDDFSEDQVLASRKVWVPTLSMLDKATPDIMERRCRAKIFASHARNNETWCKSEYAWEADAWSDAFGRMRGEPKLEM
jgi:hypothetical protein